MANHCPVHLLAMSWCGQITRSIREAAGNTGIALCQSLNNPVSVCSANWSTMVFKLRRKDFLFNFPDQKARRSRSVLSLAKTTALRRIKANNVNMTIILVIATPLPLPLWVLHNNIN
jgi:hypothetical protein